MELSKIIVFFGYLISSSMFIYHPFDQQTLNSLAKQIWLIIQTLIFFTFIIAYMTYLYTKHFSLTLELCQYIFMPLSTFIFVQHYSISKNQNSLQNQQILILILLASILSLTLIKIIYINQTFPGQKHKRILSFHLIPRIYRVLKFPISYIIAEFLTSTGLTAALSTINIIDFLISYSSIVFIEVQIESIQMLGSLNNILSFSIYSIFKQKTQTYFLYIPQLILTIVFLFIKNPLQNLLQIKYKLFFNQIQLNSTNIHLQQQKKILFMLFSCFNAIFHFDEKQKITVKPKQKNIFSLFFIQKVKNIYLSFLYQYFQQKQIIINDCFDNINCPNEKIQRKTSLKQKKVNHGQQYEKIMIQKYQKIYGKIIQNSCQIIFDKILFYDFMAYCIDMFQSNKTDNYLLWNYSHEYLLVLVTKFNQNFIIKLLKTYQKQLLNQTKANFLYKIRNTKYLNYIQHTKITNKMKITNQQKYMTFLQQYNHIKQNIVNICYDQIKFIQILLNPIQNIFMLNSFLNTKWNNKKYIFTLFHSIFDNYQYLLCQEFSYIFILFSIIFCKSLHKTTKIIQSKFIIQKIKIKNQTKNNKLPQNVLKNKHLSVCCGSQNKHNKIGDIILSNHSFKKKFTLQNDNLQINQQKICDLITNPDEKTFHFNAMLDTINYSKNQINSQYRNKHENLKCFLRVNSHQQKYPIFKSFKIKTQIYLSLSTNLCYICQIQEISSSIFLLYSNLQEIENKIDKYVKRINQFQHQQLGNLQQFIQVDHQFIKDSGLFNNFEQNQIEDDCLDYCLDEQIEQNDSKFETIEDKIWNSKSPTISIFFKYTLLCLFYFICGFITSQLTMISIKQKATKSISYINQLDFLMSQPQGCQSQYSWNFYLLKKIAQKKLNSSACQPLIPNITDLLQKQTQKLSGEKINEYFKNGFINQQVTVQSLSPSIFTELGIKFSQLLSESSFDYSNYMTSLAIKADRYLITDMSTLKGPSLIQFVQFMRVHSQAGKDSFSIKFIQAVSQNNMEHLIKNYQQYQIFVIIGTSISIGFYIASISCLFIVFYEILKHFKILLKISQQNLLQRHFQIKYIISQIQKLKQYHFKTCKFPNNNNIILTTQNQKENTKLQLNIQQFQKIGQYHFLQKNKTQCSQKEINHKTSSSFIEIFIGNKKSIISLFIFSIYLIVMFLWISFEYGQVIGNSFKMNEIIKQGGITKEALVLQQLSSWMKGFNDTEFYGMDKIQENFIQASNYIKQQKFFVLFYQLLDSKLLFSTSYLQVCQILEQSQMLQKQKCSKYLTSQFMYLRISDFISLVVNSQQKIFNRFNNGAKLTQSVSSMCYDMYSVNNIVNPGVIGSWKILNNIINQQNLTTAMGLTYLTLLLFGLFFIYFGYFLFQNYQQCLRIRFETLTMDTPKDLYENENFKADLNYMYQYSY